MLAVISAMGCLEAGSTNDPTECDARTLDSSEVRARRIPCSDELPDGGESRRSDWMLENSMLRAAIRERSGALTQVGVAGGTIVDLTPPGVDDGLVEAVPLLENGWLVSAEICAENADGEAAISVVGQDVDGGNHTVVYRMFAGDPALWIEGANGLSLAPNAGAEVVGGIVESEDGEWLIGADGVLEDHGGWISWDGASMVVAGDRETVINALWDDVVEVGGISNGEWIVGFNTEDEVVVRLPVVDGVFSGVVPADVIALAATTEGAETGELTAPGTDMSLEVGEEGVIWIRSTDEMGLPIPVTLWWNDEAWPLPPGGGRAPVGLGEGTAWVSAGPRFEAERFDDVAVQGEVFLDVSLRSVMQGQILMELGRTVWPDAHTRESLESVATKLVSRGVGFSVFVADDEVAESPGSLGHRDGSLLVETGSRAASMVGAPFAWPWTSTQGKSAHSAVDWTGLDAETLLALQDNGGRRHTVVDADWVVSAGRPADWDPAPLAMMLSGVEDVPILASVLDGRVPVTVTGPWTWVPSIDGQSNEPAHAVEVESRLVDGRTVATNGPMIWLTVDEATPGDMLYPLGPVTLEVEVSAPEWMPLDHVAIFGSGGETLAQWSTTSNSAPQLVQSMTVASGDWVMAMAWGEEQGAVPMMDAPAWAVTSPVYLTWAIPTDLNSDGRFVPPSGGHSEPSPWFPFRLR
mgnify:CR=1 FL=1